MSHLLDAYGRAQAPAATSRLIPSRYPPVSAFDLVASAADLEAVFELEGWTNDRLVAHRLKILSPDDWVFGRPNASIVMSAFLHGSAAGMRFSSSDLGAWYASTDLTTAVLEVANGLRKELSLTGLTRKTDVYREYTARLTGDFVDIVGRHPEFHQPDDSTYPTPQVFGALVREDGPAQDLVGIRYESVRRPGHDNWVSYRPRRVENVTQARHLELDVPETGKVVVRILA